MKKSSVYHSSRVSPKSSEVLDIRAARIEATKITPADFNRAATRMIGGGAGIDRIAYYNREYLSMAPSGKHRHENMEPTITLADTSTLYPHSHNKNAKRQQKIFSHWQQHPRQENAVPRKRSRRSRHCAWNAWPLGSLAHAEAPTPLPRTTERLRRARRGMLPARPRVAISALLVAEGNARGQREEKNLVGIARTMRDGGAARHRTMPLRRSDATVRGGECSR